ncbi:13856_t:CDS:2 [Entrophospora sp. SA101]|nr:14226_t:CDS:2 [Entrophospora sp. SA101]CAJ0645085.1 13856_t:CDS:2 [Entrophospora sp. SA101]CAJ0868755.1 13447_t:CDS:2 [Entrophospora sp. SA101]
MFIYTAVKVTVGDVKTFKSILVYAIDAAKSVGPTTFVSIFIEGRPKSITSGFLIAKLVAYNAIILRPTGDRMPLVGFGSWELPNDKVADSIYQALKNDYRLLDCAALYGNEKEIGDGIKKAIDYGIVKRDDIFITSKLWNTFHKKEHVRPALERTLNDLKVKYLDLYLIHFPISLKHVDPKERYPADWYYDTKNKTCIQENVTIRETWEAMEELVDSGLVRNIGISNFNAALIMDLLKYARVKPAVLQIEHHPYLTQEQLVDYAKSQGLAVNAYSSIRSSSYGPKKDENSPQLLKEPILEQIAKKYNRSTAQVALRWAVQRNIVVIPKSTNPSRLVENHKVIEFTLTDEEVKAISSLDRKLRFNDPVNNNGTAHLLISILLSNVRDFIVVDSEIAENSFTKSRY